MSVSIIDPHVGGCPCGGTIYTSTKYVWAKIGVDEYIGADIWDWALTTIKETNCTDPCPDSASDSSSDSCDPAECCKEPPECIPEECFDGYDAIVGCYGTCEDIMIQCCGQMIKCGQICKIDCKPTDSETDSDTGSSTDSDTGSSTDSDTGSSTDSDTGSSTDSDTGSSTESTTCSCPKCPPGFSETVDCENRRPVNIIFDCFDNKGKLCSSKTCYKTCENTDSETPSEFSASDSADCKWGDYDCGDLSDNPINGCFEQCVDFYGVSFTIPAQSVAIPTTFDCIVNGQVVDSRTINCYGCQSIPPGCPNPQPSPSQSECPAYTQATAQAELAAAKQSCYSNPSCRGGLINARGNLVPVGKIPNCYGVQVTCVVVKNCVLPDGSCEVLPVPCAQIYNP